MSCRSSVAVVGVGSATKLIKVGQRTPVHGTEGYGEGPDCPNLWHEGRCHAAFWFEGPRVRDLDNFEITGRTFSNQ